MTDTAVTEPTESRKRAHEDDGASSGAEERAAKRQRRRRGWDQPGDGAPTLTASGPTPMETAPTGAPAPASGPSLTPEQLAAIQQAKLIAAQTAEANPHLQWMCRLFVGNIAPEVTEEHVRNSFSVFGVVKSCNLNEDSVLGKHKGFCYIEYLSAENAERALVGMAGATMAGKPIKVGRPPPPKEVAEKAKTAGALTVKDTPAEAVAKAVVQEKKPELGDCRLYIGSIMYEITEDDIKTIFEPFGTVRSFTLMPDIETGRHKGYGFMEFDNPKSAQEAMTCMNGFNLAGRPLKVGRAATSGIPVVAVSSTAHPLAALAAQNLAEFNEKTQQEKHAAKEAAKEAAKDAPAAPAAPAAKVEQLAEVTEGQEVLSISAQQRMQLSQRLEKDKPTRCLLLTNMVGPEDVDDSLEDEVREECAQHGTVLKVGVYPARQGDELIVKIYVLFSVPVMTSRAKQALNGRFFAGRTVKAEFVDEGEMETAHRDFEDIKSLL